MNFWTYELLLPFQWLLPSVFVIPFLFESFLWPLNFYSKLFRFCAQLPKFLLYPIKQQVRLLVLNLN